MAVKMISLRPELWFQLPISYTPRTDNYSPPDRMLLVRTVLTLAGCYPDVAHDPTGRIALTRFRHFSLPDRGKTAEIQGIRGLN